MTPAPGEDIDDALTAVGADPDDPEMRELAALMLAARWGAELVIAEVRTWVAGEATALERADPLLFRIAAARVERWQAARAELIAAARPVQGSDETTP